MLSVVLPSWKRGRCRTVLVRGGRRRDDVRGTSRDDCSSTSRGSKPAMIARASAVAVTGSQSSNREKACGNVVAPWLRYAEESTNWIRGGRRRGRADP